MTKHSSVLCFVSSSYLLVFYIVQEGSCVIKDCRAIRLRLGLCHQVAHWIHLFQSEVRLH